MFSLSFACHGEFNEAVWEGVVRRKRNNLIDDHDPWNDSSNCVLFPSFAWTTQGFNVPEVDFPSLFFSLFHLGKLTASQSVLRPWELQECFNKFMNIPFPLLSTFRLGKGGVHSGWFVVCRERKINRSLIFQSIASSACAPRPPCHFSLVKEKPEESYLKEGGLFF